MVFYKSQVLGSLISLAWGRNVPEAMPSALHDRSCCFCHFFKICEDHVFREILRLRMHLSAYSLHPFMTGHWLSNAIIKFCNHVNEVIEIFLRVLGSPLKLFFQSMFVVH
uniref:Uncharacterized protein n=1 Tax=Ixodes ricinus TaxID=34613 RepID=A0A6B0UJ62_IXORI